MSEQGQKFDKNKPRMSLLPKGALNAVIRVLEFGATKYQVDNWKHVPEAKTRYYDAMQRHIDAWWQGEQKDPETGEHHLAHAICCGMFLWWFDDMDTKVLAGAGFAAKFVRKGDLQNRINEALEDLEYPTAPWDETIAHVVKVLRGAND